MSELRELASEPSNVKMPEFDQLVGQVLFLVCAFILLAVGWRGFTVKEPEVEEWAVQKVKAVQTIVRVSVEIKDQQTVLNSLRRRLVTHSRISCSLDLPS